MVHKKKPRKARLRFFGLQKGLWLHDARRNSRAVERGNSPEWLGVHLEAVLILALRHIVLVELHDANPAFFAHLTNHCHVRYSSEESWLR